MTPRKIYFTGLEIDPNDLESRIHYGVIPLDWTRHRFLTTASVSTVNQWLDDHTDGRWAIYRSFLHGKHQINLAFEFDYDAAMFVLSDGAKQCLVDK